MADIVVASTKKVNFFDKIIQSVVIAINVSKMNRAIDEHIDNLKEEMNKDKQDELEKILREIVYVKYQYEIMQKSMYELKIQYNDEIVDNINTIDKVERLEMVKKLLEMEYDRISKTVFKSKEDIRYRLLTVSSVIDKIKQEIKDEGKNIKYNSLIKCFEEIEEKINKDEYTEAMYDQLISYVNDYIAYINSNYDIARLPADERELIEFVFEDAMNSNNSDLEKYVHQYNLLVSICKNAYVYFKVIDKIFEKIQKVYDESLKYNSINSKDYFTFFKEIFDTKIKTMVNDVKRTEAIEDEYLKYCKILIEPDELEEYIIEKILETTSSVTTKKVFQDRLSEINSIKEEVLETESKVVKKVGRKPKKVVLENLDKKEEKKTTKNTTKKTTAKKVVEKEELPEIIEEVIKEPVKEEIKEEEPVVLEENKETTKKRRAGYSLNIEEISEDSEKENKELSFSIEEVDEKEIEENVEEVIEEVETKTKRRTGASKKGLGQFGKRKLEKV